MTADLGAAIARVPRLIAVLGLAGALIALQIGGLRYGTAFMVGAIGAYFNFRLIERFVHNLVQSMMNTSVKRPKIQAFKLFIELALFILGAFVILRFSGFNLIVAFCGFLVCPAAVMLESIYYLIGYYLKGPT